MATKKKAGKPNAKKAAKKAPKKAVPMLTCPVTGARVPADQAGAFGH